MHPKELEELIKSGESSTLEFKRLINNPAKAAKELSALSNTLGGILLVGVDDDGSVVGIHSEKSIEDILDKACSFYIDPPINPQYEIANFHGRDVFICYIQEGKQKPHFFVADPDEKKPMKRAYIRVGEKSVIASREMARVLKSKTENKPLKIIIGDKEKRLFDYLDRYERATVNDFANLVNISKRRAERLLVRLVKAGVIQIHINSESDYFTLVQ